MNKRLISGILSVFLLFSTGSSALASPLKKGGVHMPPGIAKKFNDLDQFKWLNNAIKNTTKLEAILMALKITGYNEEVNNIQKGKREHWKDYINNWTDGYLDIAVDKGILLEEEVKNFKPMELVKRYEIIKYIVRALGLEEEAQAAMDYELEYTDKSAIDDSVRGYICLANKIKLINGYPDNTFQPNKPVSRVQLAYLMETVNYIIENDLLDEYDLDKLKDIKGDLEIINIYSDNDNTKEDFVGHIIIKSDEGNFIQYFITEDTKIYLNNKKIMADQLLSGDTCSLKVNENNEVIVLSSTREIKKYIGTIKNVSKEYIGVSINNIYKVYQLYQYVNCYDQFNKKVDINNISLESLVTISVNKDGKVLEIKVIKDKEKQIVYVGTTEMNNNKFIIVKDYEDKLKLYEVLNDCKVIISGQIRQLSDLVKGDVIKIQLTDDLKVHHIIK